MMLRGIRIVDFTRYLPGPFATQRLAAMGAEVIKVEPPGGGDPSRYLAERRDGEGLLFLANNRNKKSVTVNLKVPEGQAIAFRLACQADVVMEGFRPGVAEALGIGYERLKQARPDLIYCSLTGFGQTGPLRDLGGHDINYMALSGVLSQLADREGRPVQPGIQFADLIGGIAASEAVLAALVKRSLTSEGSFLDIAMTDVLISMMNTHVLYRQLLGIDRGVPSLGGGIVCYNIYQTRDARYVTLGALEKKFWAGFCRAVGKEEWISAQYSPASEENEVFVGMKALFQSRTLAEWEKFSREVDCCMAPVLETGEMIRHPHVLEKGLLPDAAADCPAPSLGCHNRDVFRELLNASEREIEEWRRAGLI